MTPPTPPVIWEPRPDRPDAAITRFTDLLRTRTGRPLTGYHDLWTYSTDDLPGFWAAVAEHFQLTWHEGRARRS